MLNPTPLRNLGYIGESTQELVLSLKTKYGQIYGHFYTREFRWFTQVYRLRNNEKKTYNDLVERLLIWKLY